MYGILDRVLDDVCTLHIVHLAAFALAAFAALPADLSDGVRGQEESSEPI